MSEKHMENVFSDWNWKCFSLPGLLLEFQSLEMWNFNFWLGKLFSTSKGVENSIHLGAEVVPKSYGVPCLAPHTPANKMEKQCRVHCKHSPAFCYVLFSGDASLKPGNWCCVVLSCFHCTSEQGTNPPCILIHLKPHLIGSTPMATFYRRQEKWIMILPFLFLGCHGWQDLCYMKTIQNQAVPVLGRLTPCWKWILTALHLTLAKQVAVKQIYLCVSLP